MEFFLQESFFLSGIKKNLWRIANPKKGGSLFLDICIIESVMSERVCK
jgi:hypothetical protein